MRAFVGTLLPAVVHVLVNCLIAQTRENAVADNGSFHITDNTSLSLS
ncbi:hypothetical protein [Novosphingobium taihuense]|nr:hypothetical protein [Novosphingobium taihuense]